ncbi:Nif3-like dinuclear metal center hexameric protein [Blattabacterium cuenoti]|uniref:Nif3-like dinuclear metal center hexameric protein n=1 Tax=Blattabacterium cuenoti TaxID=1653831 RepID=UPI00163CF249|nr:Nif3-like dinuclear metal center hexameric protein [Blattabacterium cuenoti]
MKITVKDIVSNLESFAPVEYAELYDNVGLMTGSLYHTVTNILITLDLTEEVLIESINKRCNLIISFHPVIFKPIKNITGKTLYEKILIYAIKNDISIYVIHTNLDSIWNGSVSHIFQLLGIKKEKVLIPKKGYIQKLNTYVPMKYAEKVRKALFKAGAGNISNYSHCSFNFDGIGSYMGNAVSNPSFGYKKVFHMEKETCIGVIFPSHKLNMIKQALFQSHPYEEIAYEIYNIENIHPYLGLGLIGTLDKEMNENDFLLFIKEKMDLPFIRHSPFLKKKINRISIITGSGRFGIDHAIKENTHSFISSDLKYHDFFRSENKILILDIGHYESEKFNKKLIKMFLKKHFDSILIHESKINTNPVKYFF